MGGEGEKGWEETTVGGLGASYNNQIFVCVLKGKKEEGADNVGDVAGETTIKSQVLKREGGGGMCNGNDDNNGCINVRVAPYANTQHIKVPKYFVYIPYGCRIQSEACCGLNFDITTSHPALRFTPNKTQAYHCKGGPICPHTQHIKVPGTKRLYIHPIWMWDPV